jgi:hypothetical protein
MATQRGPFDLPQCAVLDSFQGKAPINLELLQNSPFAFASPRIVQYRNVPASPMGLPL